MHVVFDAPEKINIKIISNEFIKPAHVETVDPKVNSFPKATFRKFVAENNLFVKANVNNSLTDQYMTGVLQQRVQRKEIDPHSLIHDAILENSPEVIRFLLAHGVDVDYSDAYGMTPLSLAILNRCNYAVDVLLQSGANPNPPKWNGKSLLSLCIEMKSIPLAMTLFYHGAEVTSSDLYDLLAEGLSDPTALKLAEAAINRGADINDTSNKAPLMVAIGLACSGKSEILQLMVSKNVNLNMIAYGTRTPLIMAVHGGNLEVIKFLIDHGANVNQVTNDPNPEWRSALRLALSQKKPEIVQYLLQKGARA